MKSMVLRLATRESPLALTQTAWVCNQLSALGITSKVIPVKSKGDMIREAGVAYTQDTGIFTKAIDDAVLNGQADAGVHSLKDLPVELHPDLILAAVPQRASPFDVIVFRKRGFSLESAYTATVATGSIRRKAQWLYRFPSHRILPVRGNVDSRLIKLQQSAWDGIILAQAGLSRLGAQAPYKVLHWMIPAPAQGAIGVVARRDNHSVVRLLSKMDHAPSRIAVNAERQFLQALAAGCTAPVGALASFDAGLITFKGEVLSPDGREKVEITFQEKAQTPNLGLLAATMAKNKGADRILLFSKQK
ncbi:MAG: hydroxymethylbilane synthase [Chitinophagales bacterium]|nr:MAG: hydroxymethylbilane synthase [Chitinophagales bacterium]